MPKLNELESYVFPAKRGDMGRYKVLFDAFLKEGIAIFRTFAKNYSIYSIEEEEIIELLSEQFLRILKNHRRKYGSFASYSKKAIGKSVKSFCFRKITKEGSEPVLSFDLPDRDGLTLLEKVESEDYENLIGDINYNDFVFKISSKSSSDEKTEKQKSLLVLYRLNGYSREEICKKIKISEGRYRYLLRLLEEDPDYINIKIDLK